jgi:hypothetical protein
MGRGQLVPVGRRLSGVSVASENMGKRNLADTSFVHLYSDPLHNPLLLEVTSSLALSGSRE